MTHALDTPEMFMDVRRRLEPMEIASVLDIGCYKHPQGVIAVPRHVLVDPFQPYIDAHQSFPERYCMDWEESLDFFEPKEFEAIFLLDVIEHLEKEQGQELLPRTVEAAGRVVVIFTPTGFVEQNPIDASGELQRHKSGWLPEEFGDGWTIINGIHAHGVDPLHGRSAPAECFFAIHGLGL